MTLNCRFCGEPMFCVRTENVRNNTDGKVVGYFTCECKGFKKNADQRNIDMLLFENSKIGL